MCPLGMPANRRVSKSTCSRASPLLQNVSSFHAPGQKYPSRAHTHGAYTIGVKRENSRAAGKLVTEYTVSVVTYGGDLDSTRVAKPEVHAEVR